MSEGMAKRFWKEARVVTAPGGWGIALDGKAVRTPAKAPLVATTEALAAAAAAEWNAQGEHIAPATMPVTRTLNTAIDRIAKAREAVVDDIAGYGGADLICYRAEEPEGLVARQEAAWDPLMTWSREALDAPLIATRAVRHVAQPPHSLARLRALVAAFDDVGLAGLYDLTAIGGSLVTALAVARGRLGVEDAWEATRIDETWQAERWGQDAEAMQAAANKHADFRHAARILALAASS